MAHIKINGQIITSISGSLKQCSLVLQGAPFGKHRTQLPSQKLRKQHMTKKRARSRSHGKRLKDRPSKIKYQGGQFCACDTYLIADWLWRKRAFRKNVWRKAVKKPGITGYDLWLMEACYLGKQGLYLPDNPSNSGGWSKYAAVPGTMWQPAADCVVAPKDIGNYISRAWEDPEHTRLAWLSFHGIDPANFPTHMIVDETWMLWYYDPKHPLANAHFSHRFDNFATGQKIWNPIYPERPSGICKIYVKSTHGTLMIYEQDRTQPDGLDRAALANCSHVLEPPYLARGEWE